MLVYLTSKYEPLSRWLHIAHTFLEKIAKIILAPYILKFQVKEKQMIGG